MVKIDRISQRFTKTATKLTKLKKGSRVLLETFTASDFFYFTYPPMKAWKRTIFYYHPRTQSANKFKLPKRLGVDVIDSRMVQSHDSILLFKYGYHVDVFKIDLCLRDQGSESNIDAHEAEPVVKKLPSLWRKARDFSVANFKNKKIILSGGFDQAATLVSIYDLELSTWSKAPPMNYGREDHASCCLGDKVYVFSGFENQGSIESLDVIHGQEW